MFNLFIDSQDPLQNQGYNRASEEEYTATLTNLNYRARERDILGFLNENGVQVLKIDILRHPDGNSQGKAILKLSKISSFYLKSLERAVVVD
jgi:hypothetical protein